MKYLKYFENVVNKKYWVIPLDDYYFIRLVIKLDLSIDQAEEIYEFYLDLYGNQQMPDNEEIFFFVAFNENGELYEWKYYEALGNENNIRSKDFEEEGFIRQPNIEITQEDINEWQMIMDTDKYNL